MNEELLRVLQIVVHDWALALRARRGCFPRVPLAVLSLFHTWFHTASQTLSPHHVMAFGDRHQHLG
ncbi:MAG: hypothetical protein QOJ99_433 [Bryobacterales bacterium]|nr:hypothetical protein [Bryobacterales bacterium]